MGQGSGHRDGPRPPLAGWAPPTDDVGRPVRGVADLLAEAFGTYRRRWRDLLALSLLTEGLVTLIALPYTMSAGSQTLELVSGLGAASDGGGAIAALPRLVTDPALAALGGVLSVVPLGGTLILMAAVTALLLAPQPEAHTWRGALARAVEYRVPILGPVIALALFAAVIQLGVASLAGSTTGAAGPAPVSGQMIVLALLLLLLAPALLIAAVYLAIRWAVAVPVLVMEPATLRRSLARSVMLTRRRTLHVGLSLLAVYGLSGILGGVVTTLAVFGTAGLTAAGAAWPVLLVPATLHLATRVVLAPIGAIVPALLYRELRLASDGASPIGRNTNTGPDPRRSAGVP